MSSQSARSLLSRASLMAAAALLGATSAAGATYQWTGNSGVNQNYDNGANWVETTWTEWGDYVFNSNVVNGTVNINVFCGTDTLSLQSGLTTDITINGPVPLVFAGNWGHFGTISIAADSRNLTINTSINSSGEVTWNVGAGRTLTFTQGLSDWGTAPATLVKSGAGTAMLTGSSSYSGVTILAGGVVNAATFANNGTASSLGVGTGDTAGDNIGLLFRGGVLQYTGSTAQSTDRAIRLSTTGGGGTIDASGSVPSATLSFTRASMPNWWENGGNRTLTLTGINAGENTLSAGIADTAGTKINLTKSGVGTWVLAGAGNYLGVTNINAGTLIAASSGALGTGGLDGATMTWISNGATLALRGDISMNEHLHVLGTGVGGLGAIRNLAGANALTMTIGLDGDTTIGVNAGTLTLTNALYGDGALNASNLTKVGNGVLVLSGTNLYSGVTVFAGGVVQATTLADNGTASSLGVGTGDPGGDSIGLLFRGGALRYAGSTAQTTDRAIRLSTSGGGGTIDASGSVSSATLTFTRASMPNWWEAPGVRTLTLTGINTGENTLAAGIADTAGTKINLTKSGVGTWVLAGAGNYVGVTNINAGVLLVTNSTSLGVGGWDGTTMTNVLDGATLALRGGISLDEHMHVWGAGVGGLGAIRSLSGNNALTIGGNNGNGFALRSNTVVGVDADTLTVTGFYESGGSFGLTKVGTGTLVLTANNAYTGATTINGGTLQIGNGGGGSLAGGSAVVIAAGGRLVNATTNGNSLSLGVLTLTGGELAATNTPAWNLGNYLLRGDVTVGGSVPSTISADVRVGFSEDRLFTVADVDGGSGVDLLISGKISHYNDNSWGYATKAGAGTMKISGVNDIGRLTVSAGLLILENDGVGLLRNGGLINNATTDFSVVGTKTASYAITGSGSLRKSGIGTLVLSGNNPFSGGIILNAGTLQATRNTLGSGAVIVNNGATLYANDQWVFCGINGYGEPSRNVASVTLNAGAVLYMDPTAGYANGITNFFLGGGSVTGGANDDTRGALFLFNGNEQITAGGGVVSTIGVSIGLNGNNNSITVDAGSRLDMTNVLKRGDFSSAGRGGFVKNGGGTLVLSGANSYDGVTDIAGGTLIAASNTAIGAGGHAGETMSYIRDGATLALQGGVSLDEHFHVWGSGVGGLGAVLSLSGNNALTNSPGGGPGFTLRTDTVVGVDADTLTVSGFYQEGGSFGLTKVGTGTLVLAATNNYTGDTTVSAGTLKIGSGATGSLYSPSVSWNGNLTFGSAGAIVNDSALVYDIAGGAVHVNRTISGLGTVSVTGNQSVHFANGTTISTTGAQTYSATATGGRYYGFNLADNATVALSSSGAISMTGMLGTGNGHTGRLTINTSAGNGDVTLNTPVGVSGVDYGLAELTVNAGVGAITLGTYNGQAWGTVNAISLTGGAINATATLAAFTTLTVTNSAASTFSGSLSGSGSLSKSGIGTLTLSAHHSYTGGTNVNAGTLNIDVQGTQGASAVGGNKAVFVASGATLRLNKTDGLGYYDANPSSLTIAGSMTIAEGIHASIANFGITLSGGTLISEGAGDGLGNYVLDGAVTTLANAASSVISANSIGLRNGSTANQSVVFAVADGAAAIDLLVSSVLTNGSGTNGLTKTGNGVMVLTGSSSYSGATTVSAGTLIRENSYAAGSHAVASGAVLEFAVASGNRDSATTTFSGGGTLRKTGIGGVIWGSGVVTFSLSSGALIDVRAGTFTGGSWGNDNWGANLSDLNVESGAVFSTVEANARVNKITGSGTIKTGYNGAGYQNLTIGVDNGSSTFAGVIANAENAGSLLKTGSGTISLTGANTYSGATSVSAGILAITSGGGIYRGGYNTPVITIASGATLELQNWNYNETTASLGGLRASASSMVVNGGTIRMTGTTSYGRGVTVNAGGATLEAATGANWTIDTVNDSAAWVYDSNPTVTLNGAGTGTFQKVLAQGTGALVKNGTGTWTLSGANTYTGATNVTGGTLIINGSTSIASAVTVGLNGTLGGTGTVGGNTTISGLHSPGNSPGIQTFTGNLSYVNAGAPGPTVNWELASNTTTVGVNPTANFDQVIVGGNLDFTHPTNINLSFNAVGSTVLWSDTLWDTNQSWLLYDVAGITTNIANLNLNTVNWLDSGSNLFSTAGGSFTLGQSGQDVMLNFSPIPEPSTYGIALGAMALALAAVRRQRRKKS